MFRRRKASTPQSRAVSGIILGIASMCFGLLYVIPEYELIGQAWTMISAVVTGIYYTRYNRLKRGEKDTKSPENGAER